MSFLATAADKLDCKKLIVSVVNLRVIEYETHLIVAIANQQLFIHCQTSGGMVPAIWNEPKQLFGWINHWVRASLVKAIDGLTNFANIWVSHNWSEPQQGANESEIVSAALRGNVNFMHSFIVR